MYVEWEGDTSDLRLVARIHLDVSETGDQGTVFVKTADHARGILFMGSEKDAQAVFNAMRKRMGVTLITAKWLKKVVAKRWKGAD